MGLHSTSSHCSCCYPFHRKNGLPLLLSWPSVSHAALLHPVSGAGKSTSPANAIISAVLSSFTFVMIHFEMNKGNKIGN